MRVLITEKGIRDKDENSIPVGTEMEIKGDELPLSFVNKCQILPDGKKKASKDDGKTFITNPDDKKTDDKDPAE